MVAKYKALNMNLKKYGKNISRFKVLLYSVITALCQLISVREIGLDLIAW